MSRKLRGVTVTEEHLGMCGGPGLDLIDVPYQRHFSGKPIVLATTSNMHLVVIDQGGNIFESDMALNPVSRKIPALAMSDQVIVNQFIPLGGSFPMRLVLDAII